MPIQEEKSFPRGGKEPSTEHAKVRKIRRLGNAKVSRKSSHKLKLTRDSTGLSKITSDQEPEQNAVYLFDDISRKVLAEGMICLGCVREINDLELKINLPGRIIGFVPATEISEEYSKHLKQFLSGEKKEPRELNDLFKPGQFVVTKIKQILDREDEKIIVTLNPNEIQSDFSISNLMKGLTVPASVQSIEDHGYVMNCGIPSVRAFLKKSQSSNFEKTWNDGKQLGVGQVLRCLITKYTAIEGCSNVELSADPETVANALFRDVDVPMASIIPGMCFVLSVLKVRSSGLVVNFSDNYTGYVHTNYLSVGCVNIQENEEIQGRVMYIEPLTKNVFFTALENVCGLHPPLPPFEDIKKGQVFMKAKVVKLRGGHVILELDDDRGIYGYVTDRHLDIGSVLDIETSCTDVVKQKYSVGSICKCKVLEYDYMVQKYTCTLKSKEIHQKYSSLEDIAPGDVALCVVQESTPRKIRLKVGNIFGIVEPMHCTDVPVSAPHTLLKEGQMVKAKVSLYLQKEK